MPRWSRHEHKAELHPACPSKDEREHDAGIGNEGIGIKLATLRNFGTGSNERQLVNLVHWYKQRADGHDKPVHSAPALRMTTCDRNSREIRVVKREHPAILHEEPSAERDFDLLKQAMTHRIRIAIAMKEALRTSDYQGGRNNQIVME